MRFAVIVSRQDIAGMNIRSKLFDSFSKSSDYKGEAVYNNVENGKEISLYTLSTDTIFSEGLENDIKADFFIFATRHQSKSGEKTLSVHFPGNLAKAEYGGSEKELCKVHAGIAKSAFINLNELGKDLGFAITMEATHHGPHMTKPTFFIEIGSKAEEWQDEKAGNAIASTILKTVREFEDKPCSVALGFGGSHYCSAFNKIELESDVAMSHICPKYMIGSIDEEMVRKMVEATTEKVDFALLDWNGLSGSDKDKLKGIFEKIGLEWKKTKDI